MFQQRLHNQVREQECQALKSFKGSRLFIRSVIILLNEQRLPSTTFILDKTNSCHVFAYEIKPSDTLCPRASFHNNPLRVLSITENGSLKTVRTGPPDYRHRNSASFQTSAR